MLTNFFIISGPSGAGEDSVIRGLKKSLPIEKIVTATTRKKRPREIHGKDYYFISAKEFKQGIDKDQFFEYMQQDNGQFYGVKRKEIKRVINSDRIGIWKIEYKGVMAAKKFMPEAISILIMPPSLEILEQRLLKRGEKKDFIKKRIDYANEWLEHKDIYDHTVVNKENKLEETVNRVKEIILTKLKKR